MKILITGSRNYKNHEQIRSALLDLNDEGLIIVHGDCATGADALADHFGKLYKFVVRRYPADWSKDGKAAGPRRNERMFEKEHLPDEPIDFVLAFSEDLESSRGTSHCVSVARRYGIEVRLFK